MSLLNISRRCLVKLEIANEELIAYSNDSLIPKKFSLIGVTSLDCSMNQLTSLPTALPEGLEVLWCFDNSLTDLPLLPKRLKVLSCFWNKIKTLPALPESLKSLSCSHNQLTELPLLPEGLEVLYCNDNPLEYVSFFKERPSFLTVPWFLAAEHSEENYQEGYQLQETNRYFFLTIFIELGLQLDFLK